MKIYKLKFKQLLQNKGYASSTIQSYIKSLEQYELWCSGKLTTLNQSDKKIAFQYLKYIKKKSSNPSTINGAIHPLKLYYRLCRKDNPFEYIYFKREIQQLNHNSFSKSELEQIYNDYPQRTLTQIRDKVLLGLYVYQGLKSSEMKNVKVADIFLDEFRMGTNGDSMSNARLLDINIQQLVLLSDYIKTYREQLLIGIEKEELIVTSKKVNCIESIIWQLSKKLKKSEHGFENFNQIRRSVIHSWLEEYDLRIVQYLCGHRYISSTEKFITNDIKELKNEVEKYFPL